MKVAKIQWRNADDATAAFADAETLTVAQGARLEFKAVADPTGAWPSEKPVWGGAASGTGEAATVSFDSASTSDTDLKTVTAECGNTVEVKVLVVKIDKLQYRVGGVGEWADAPSYPLPLLVATGASVEFRAVRSPAGEVWPGGKPVWSGNAGASGSGPSKTVTFGIASTSDTDFKTVTAECGNTVTVNVLVKNRSGAWVRLYKDEALTQEIGGETPTVGGPVWVVVELQIGEGEQVDADLDSVTVRLHEEPDAVHQVTHLASEDHFDQVFDLTSNWQKQEADGTWGTTTESPKTANTGQEPIFYRTKFLWNTTGTLTNADPDGEGPLTANTLLGHNGPHTVNALSAVSFEPVGGGNSYSNGPASQNVTVGNLVIIEAKASDGNLDVVRYDPDSDDPSLVGPTLSFEFEDGDYQTGDRYKYFLILQETGTASVSYTPQMLPDGPPTAFTVAMPSAMPRGAYGFDVEISKWRGDVRVDAQSLRSPHLHFEDTKLDIDNDEFKFHYRIVPQPEAPMDLKPLSELQAVAVTAELQLGGIVQGEPADRTINVPGSADHIIDEPDPATAEAGAPRVVAVGVDDEAVRHRDHQRKRLLPLNTRYLDYKVYLVNGPNVPALQPNGGGLKYDWAGAMRNAKSYPGFRTKLPNAAKTNAWFSFEIENAPRGYHPPQANVTSATPEEIWKDLVNKAEKNRMKAGYWQGLNPHPTLIQVFSHANQGRMSVTPVKPSDSENGAGWISQAGGQRTEATPYEYYLSDAPMLIGVVNFHAQGCGTSGQAGGTKHTYQASASQNSKTNPAAFVSLYKGAENSVGYYGLCNYLSTNPNRNRAQAWYNCFYRVGIGGRNLSDVYNNANAQSSLLAAEHALQGIMNEWTAADEPNVPYDLGLYDEWVPTYPNKPLIDN